MTNTKQEKYIRNRNFDDLFIEQGWDEAQDDSFNVELREGETCQIQAKFQKRGFAVCFCEDERVLRLNTAERKRLLHKLGSVYYEHLLIVHSPTEQHWLVSIRQQDSPIKTVIVKWQEKQGVQKLQERLAGLIFPIKEEENLSIADVVARVRSAFSTNAEAISKKFYHQYQTELQKFDSFIEGITDKVKRKEYAALMLNRLMFIYFIQKKEFLDGDIDYLQNRLKQTKEKFGKDKFHSKFYREFLRSLFHKGLGTPASERSEEINQLLGKVPYLNGGLFDPSQLEIENDEIVISDDTFEELFKFFDKYNWHLDDRPTADGMNINPEVLGYIFEKYINDRAQMGAYYTQEDITDYIAKNTILPFLLRKAREGCKNAFDEHNGVWQLLKENPNHYIYDAVKHGCVLVADSDIPQNIRHGIDTTEPNLLERRKDWNTPAPPNFALPTETWREVITRRARYTELHSKLKNGEIYEIDDLITYNLDITSFVEDTLKEYEGADYITTVFKAIAGVRQNWVKGTNGKTKRGISILDPSCGSGAFLFAALKILEPLYETCIERMKDFVKQGYSGEYQFFRAVLAEIDSHQNSRYWIYKTIILENLYGVDIMPEAAEIAKLRLFLKLAAEAEYDSDKNNYGLEPLPDIDYNIRSGNSLVGFASMQQFEQTIREGKGLLDEKIKNKVRGQAKETQLANDRFRQAQDRGDSSYIEAKQELAKELETLNETLNEYLAEDYGQGKDKPKRYKEWKETHQPFHWLADFYGIIEDSGGFDVVIGNPPYVKYSEAKKEYTVKNYTTEKCNNLYAMFVERVNLLTNNHIGMIVPISLPSTPKMQPAREIIYNNSAALHISNFADRPSTLFNGVHQKTTILIWRKGRKKLVSCTTNFLHWYTKKRKEEENGRKYLFQTIYYYPQQDITDKGEWRKIGARIEENIWNKILSKRRTFSELIQRHPQFSKSKPLYLNMRLMYWVKCMLIEKKSREFKLFYPTNKDTTSQLMAILNSSLFFWSWETISDCWHLTNRELDSFNIDFHSISNNNKDKLLDYSNELESGLEANKKYIGSVQTDYEYYHRKSKHIIDKIDIILAKHYGFSDEELDYIINYDIKYRMGSSNE